MNGHQPASLDLADCEIVFKLVHRHTAVLLGEGKQYLVATRLQPVVEQMGMHSLNELIAALRAGPSIALEEAVVQAMITNETSFFRDVHPFESLRTSLIPEILQRNSQRRTLTIWSAGCSSGQEPYSIAMSLKEHFPELDTWTVSIFATDISGWMLDRAQQGLFGQLEVNRGLPAQLLVKYFHHDGVRWRIDDSIRKMVSFSKANLIGDWPSMPPLDLIFLRNVLIYFDVPTKQAILERVKSVMHPDGYLLLGGSETPMIIDNGFERRAEGMTMWYRKKASALDGSVRN